MRVSSSKIRGIGYDATPYDPQRQEELYRRERELPDRHPRAEHYGVPGVYGTSFRKVTLDKAVNRGFLIDPKGDLTKIPAGDYGPVPTLAKGLTLMAQSGALDGILMSQGNFYQTDYTKQILFLGDGSYLDDAATAARLAEKLWHLRVFDDDEGNMGRSVAEGPRAVLVVSQFTLYGDTRKGRRPTWDAAAPRPVAEPLVDAVVDRLRERGARVPTGVFGADMQVALVNDGPITLWLEV